MERSLDILRAHILISWVGALLICAGMGAILGWMGYSGLSFGDMSYYFTHLSASMLPTIVVLVGYYFAQNPEKVHITAGQRTVGLILSYSYVSLVVFTAVASLFIAKLIDQNNVNHFDWLTSLQPVVVGPIFYIFGSAKKQEV